MAAEAAGVVAARAASILLLDGPKEFRLAGAHGLSPGYAARLDRAPALAPGLGPSGLAVQRRRPFAITDTEHEAEFAPWRPVARGEGYRAMVSVPLPAGAEIIGSLNVYRPHPGPWPERELELLRFFGEHAASAIRTAQTIERQTRQVDALARLVRGLREQTHEHANHLHAVRGLLALGAPDEALRFVEDLETAHHVAYGSISSAIGQHVDRRAAAGRADGRPAARDRARDRRREPARAAPGPAHGRRRGDDHRQPARERVRRRRRRSPPSAGASGCGSSRTARRCSIRVADRGEGLDAGALERGVSTKDGHAGVGLTLVRDAVSAAGGTLSVASTARGSTFTVSVPMQGD